MIKSQDQVRTKNNNLISKVSIAAQGRNIYLPFLPNVRSFAKEFEHATTPNWDGNGAVAISQSTLLRVDRLISAYGSTEYLEEISPKEDGSLSLVWDDYAGNYAYIGIGPGETVHVYYKHSSGEEWEGVSLFSDKRIISAISEALRFLHKSPHDDGTFRDNQPNERISFLRRVA